MAVVYIVLKLPSLTVPADADELLSWGTSGEQRVPHAPHRKERSIETQRLPEGMPGHHHRGGSASCGKEIVPYSIFLDLAEYNKKKIELYHEIVGFNKSLV